MRRLRVQPQLSAAQRRSAPGVQSPFLVRPGADRPFYGNFFQLRRDLDPVAVRVVYENEQVIPGAVAAGSPFNWDSQRCEVIAPVPNAVPAGRFVTVMVEPVRVRKKNG